MKSLPLEEEQKLLKRWNDGECSNEELFEQYRNLIWFFVTKKLPRSLWEDGFQECACAFFQIAKEYDFREVKFSTFLLSQLRAVITDFYRRLKEDLRCESFEFDSIPVRDKEVNYFRHKLRLAISALTDKEKKLIYLIYFKGYNGYEAARILNIPYGSISRWEKKALEKMRAVLCPRSEEDKIRQKVLAINFDDI